MSIDDFAVNIASDPELASPEAAEQAVHELDNADDEGLPERERLVLATQGLAYAQLACYAELKLIRAALRRLAS